MRPKLIINRHARTGEFFVSGDAHPTAVREVVDALLGVTRDDEGAVVGLDRPDRTLVTYSGVAIEHFLRVCRFEGEPHPMQDVYFSRRGTDHRVVGFTEEARLVHFDLGELYADLELDGELDKHLQALVAATAPGPGRE